MKTFDEAVKIVRDRFPNDLIRSGVDFDGKFVFDVSPGKQLIKCDLAVLYAIVDKTTGELTTDSIVYFLYCLPSAKKKKFNESWKNCRYVDITKEDIEKLTWT